MTDKRIILAFERKLQQLKEEESKILKILKDVRNQLRKYEVEELQTCNESIARENEEDSESDQNSDGDNETLLRYIDSAGIVNASSLDLGTNKIFGESNKESEDSDDESDISIK